jgi:hypothetical protein
MATPEFDARLNLAFVELAEGGREEVVLRFTRDEGAFDNGDDDGAVWGVDVDDLGCDGICNNDPSGLIKHLAIAVRGVE